MTPLIPQPTLPAEGAYTETERLFIAEEPPSLFPENQNSNWGLFRRILTDPIQDGVDQLDQLFSELFIDTALGYLSNWEAEYGVPDSSNYSTINRRTTLSNRKVRAPFTRARVKSLIERYIGDTSGAPAEFGAAGIPITSAGIAMFGEATGAVSTLYRVYEDAKNFKYYVRILNTVTPAAALLRELQWITPAHLTLVYDNTVTDVLNYDLDILTAQPLMFFKLEANGNDFSGNTPFNGTMVGTSVFGGDPTLVVAAAGGVSSTLFNGASRVTIPRATGGWPWTSQTTRTFSLETWVKITARPSAGNFGTFFGLGDEIFGIDQNGFLVVSGTSVIRSNAALANATVYHVVFTQNGGMTIMYVNGVAVAATGTVTGVNTEWFNGTAAIGAWPGVGTAGHFFNGDLQKLAVYDRVLTPAEILEHYRTGTNVA